MNRRLSAHAPLWGAVLVLLLAAWLARQVEPLAYAGGRARDEEERLRRNSSALAAMLGEFRTSISDIMFIKTERYLHGGIAYLAHHAESALSAGELADEIDEHQQELTLPGDFDPGDVEIDYGHAGTPTLLPTPERDYRGRVGVLYRQVRPWRHPDEPHLHTDGRDLLPWFRIMTLTDPQYVRGYVAGAFWLTREDRDAALAFIDEGLAGNPDAFQLYVSRAFMRVRAARELDEEAGEAVTDLYEQARSDFRIALELGFRQRPDDVDEEGFGSGGWNSYMDNDLLSACRMDILLTDRLEGAEAAAQRAALYTPHFDELADW